MSAEALYRATIVGLEKMLIETSEKLVQGLAKRGSLAETGAAYLEATARLDAIRDMSVLVQDSWKQLTEPPPEQREPADEKDKPRARQPDDDSEPEDDGGAGTDDGTDESY